MSCSFADAEKLRVELQVWIPEEYLRDDGTTYVTVVGACETLGDWDPDKGVAMRKCDEGLWVLHELPEDIPCGTEYKYVIMNGLNPEEMNGVNPEETISEDAPSSDVPEESPSDTSNPVEIDAGPESAVGPNFESCGNRRWPRIFDWSSPPPEHHFGHNEQNRGWEPCDPITIAEGPEIKLLWGSKATCGSNQFLLDRPCAILHAFHWQFNDVKNSAPEIAQSGFDAVQISPAQKSRDSPWGDEKDNTWWWRYQPVNYLEIHGLGSEEDLRAACDACQGAGIRVIADVVFNHMVVVATASEWEKAQSDPALFDELKHRLEAMVGPTFNIADFQWPWIQLQGDLWDQSPSRFDGWGHGEWSTLDLYSPSVVSVHEQHLHLLRECGCSGFRIDAAKHMRPDVVANYERLAKQLGKQSDIFVYAEVLGNDTSMHREYQHARPSSSKVPVRRESMEPACGAKANRETDPMATSDFQLAVWLRRLIDGGEIGWPRLSCKHSNECYEVPLLARNSIRFLRNHDTIGNEENIGGLGGFSLRAASVATAWLLSVHDGVPLVLADDVFESKLIRQAARYRQQVRTFLKKLLPEDAASVWTDVRIRGARKGRQPGLICIAIRESAGVIDCDVNNQHDGPCIGFVVLNPTINDAAGRFNGAKQGLNLRFQGSGCLEGSVGLKFAAVVDNDGIPPITTNHMAADAAQSRTTDSVRPTRTKNATSVVSIAPGGKLLDAEFIVPPSSGLFFLRDGVGHPIELPINNEDECEEWSIIDTAFNAPGSIAEKKGASPGELASDVVHLNFTLLSAETDFNQQIIVCGSAAELGNWNPEQGIVMTTDPASYPMWSCSADFSADSLKESICYKYVRDYRACGGGFDWEHSENRLFDNSERGSSPMEECKGGVNSDVKQSHEDDVAAFEHKNLERAMGA